MQAEQANTSTMLHQFTKPNIKLHPLHWLGRYYCFPATWVEKVAFPLSQPLHQALLGGATGALGRSSTSPSPPPLFRFLYRAEISSARER